MSPRLRLLFAFVTVLCLFYSSAFGQQAAPRARITSSIDENRLVRLSGNTHPLARKANEVGLVSDSTPIRRMLLVMSRSVEQETALQKLLEDQQTPDSPQYHQWLTPAQFGEKFGPAASDVEAVRSWLNTQGFQVDHVSSGRNVIEFSGNAAQIRQAFHTQMRQYAVAGRPHFANDTDPQIPAALAPVVRGIASLNNFDRKPSAHDFGVFYRDTGTGTVQPEFTVSNGTSTYYAVGPADFATIYNSKPLQQAGIDGRGRTIAIAGRTNINLQDVADFRNMFGLGAGNTTVVVDGVDPGILQSDESEALLDVEWANASAPGASVVFVTASDTEASSGVDLASLYVVENNLADTLSVSYGICEAGLGTTGNQLVQNLWQQAAAQGITVVVGTGDGGSAGCDDFNNDFVANQGLAVNGIASTPFNVAVGGTDFNDVSTASQYWSTTNAATTFLSAKSYIPERTWNLSCAITATTANPNVCPAIPASGTPPPSSLNIIAASGGPSTCSSTTGSGASTVCHGTPKPAWQTGAGVPSDGVRDLPDVSLFSSIGSDSKSFYVICRADAVQGNPSCQLANGNIYFNAIGGTSAAAPNFAGIVALAQQKMNARLGNLNYLLYSLAAKAGSSCTSSGTQAASCIFHDVVQGNISVPCAAGSPNCSVTTGTSTGVLVDKNKAPAYVAATAYDLATGLGSVNVANLVNAIATATAGFTKTTTSLTLNGATTQVTAKHGDPISVAVSVTPTTATGSIALVGPNKGIDDRQIASGTASWSSSLFPGGSYPVKARYPGDGTRGASDSNLVAVSISPEASKTFVNLLTFDLNGIIQSYTATTAAYGSPYVLRMDVTDAAGTISSSQGVSSTCSNHQASCPTGTLTLTANGVPLDAGNYALNGSGISEDSAVQLTPGSYNLNANFPGDPSYSASSGSSVVAITKAPTTIIVGVTGIQPLPYGSLDLFGTVTTKSNGVAPTGTMTFTDNGGAPFTPPVFLYQGSGYLPNLADPYAWFTGRGNYNSAPVGTHVLTAQYSGDANYAAGTSAPVTITIVQATPYFLSYGFGGNVTTPMLPVTMSVNLAGPGAAPTGTVSFLDNGTVVPGTVTYNSQQNGILTAQLIYTFTQLGTHNIIASYSGDNNYTSLTQSLGVLTVNTKLTTNVQQSYVNLNPALVNYPARLAAQIFPDNFYYYSNLPNMTGTVTFLDNGVAIGSPVVTSSYPGLFASLDYTFTTTGIHNITIQYGGDSVYAPSQSQPYSWPVNSTLASTITAPFTATGAPTAANQPVTLAANVVGIPGGPDITGTVTFMENGTPLGAPATVSATAGFPQATFVYTFTSTGTHTITAQYSGNSSYSAAVSQATPLSVEGPIWINMPNNQFTFGNGGGTTSVYFWTDNNTGTDSTVTITCTPDSSAASCSVPQPNITVPAHSMYYMNVNVTVPALSAASQSAPRLWLGTTGIMFCGFVLGAGVLRQRRRGCLLLFALLIIFSFLSCGGGGGGGGGKIITPPPPPPPQAKTYHFTVTASSGGNTSSQDYSVTVQP